MDALGQGLSAVADPATLLLLVVGVSAGMLVGAFPGVTATMAVAIASSFTLAMSPLHGLSLLLGIYMAALFGDRIPAILVNAPGTPASIASTFDGFPLAKSGRAGLALGVSAIGSSVGAFVGILVFALIAAPLAQFALRFGPAELFALAVFGLTMMVSVAGKSLVRGGIAGLIGLSIGVVGFDPVFGFQRFTLGIPELTAGVSFIPVIIGLFGIAEVFDQILTRRRNTGREVVTQIAGLIPKRSERRVLFKPVLMGSGIGAAVGAVPAAGGEIAGLLSWDRAKKMSKHPERFGKGSLEGLAAADTANNAVVGGALTTTLALGIPGDAVTAILLGAMLIWGIPAGPTLFVDQPDLVYSIVAILALAAVLATILSLFRIKAVVKLLDLPKPLLWTSIVLFCMAGTFAVENSLFDVWIMLGAGMIGLLFRRLGIPPGPIILGLILGPIAESNLRRSLDISRGSWDIFFTSPIVVVLLLLSISAIVSPAVRSWRRARVASS